MKLLLDTHAFLQILRGDSLGPQAQALFDDVENELYLSAASYWEICIKHHLGKLPLKTGWFDAVEVEMQFNDIRWLNIEIIHCQNIIGLADIHRDPFDRLLIAQARTEGMTILTADERIQQYPVTTAW